MSDKNKDRATGSTGNESSSDDVVDRRPLTDEPAGDLDGEVHAPHQPDRTPTEEEEKAADDAAKRIADPHRVAEHEREMNKIGAEIQGEGAVD